jgi:predicted TIM-barrel fold metal-dependent hydrolase
VQVLLGDMDDAVAEVRWAREAGLFGGVLLPGTPPGSSAPQLYSAVYEPLWAVCEELDMPINHHAGSASPEIGIEPASRAVYMVEITWFAHRALWHLVYGGAFKRHPGLKFVLTEQGSGWVPGVLDMLDYYHRRLVDSVSKSMMAAGSSTAESRFGAGLADMVGKAPSEYWRQNFYLGASFMRPDEVPLRHAVGLDKLMWGSDYPHDEGTFPYSREALRNSFAGLPHEEIVAILGGNAARVYGFDFAKLSARAAEVGPTVAEIDEPLKEAPAGATSPTFATESVIRVW